MFKPGITFDSCLEATRNLIKKNILEENFKTDVPTLKLICVELGMLPNYKPNLTKIKNVFIRHNVSFVKIHLKKKYILIIILFYRDLNV